MEIPEQKGPEAKRRLVLVVSVLVANLVLEWAAGKVATEATGGWIATGVTFAVVAVIVGYLIRYRDPLMARLSFLGLVVGLAELPADAWAVSGVEILDYNPAGPFIWDSPLYMPFSWGVTVVVFGYAGIWIASRWGLPVAALALAVVGGLTLPGYETGAHYAHFWSYHDCWRVFGNITPVFLLFTETLISLTIPVLAVLAMKARVRTLVLLGLAEGAWMYAISPLFFYFVGQPPG
jgi:hypothetical protein